MRWHAFAVWGSAGILVALLLPRADLARTLDAPPPSLDPVASTTGALAGGETVVLTGENLAAITGVTFGDQDAVAVSVTNAVVEVVVPNAADYAPASVEITAWVGSQALDTGATHAYEVRTAVDRQLQYAFAHWDSYNTAAYGDFNVWGGDCMNFVSQTLVARGWQTTSDWFNDAQRDWASPFVYAPDFDAWMQEHPELGTRLGMDQADQVKIGDVVLMDWEGNGFFNHAQVVSAIDWEGGEPRVLMVGHNVDSTYRDLETALADDPNGYAVFWSIP
jgi:hypothetical protein